MMEELASAGAEPKTVMIDAPDLNPHRIGHAKWGMNTKLHGANGRPLSFFMTAGQVGDCIGAAALRDDPPTAQWLLGDRGDDADLNALQPRACSPPSQAHITIVPVRYDKRQYKRAQATRKSRGSNHLMKLMDGLAPLKWRGICSA